MSILALSSVDDDIDRFCTAKMGEELPYDNLVYKVMACVPLIGSIANLFIFSSLDGKICQEKNPVRAVQLINLKNTYKICSVARNIFLSVASAAWGGFLVPCLCFVLAIAHYDGVRHNQRVVREIIADGAIKPGLEIK